MGKKRLFSLKAVTLAELLFVLIIIGILVSFAVPSYQRAIEHNKGKEAETDLKIIYNAQTRYNLDNGEYYACNDDCDKNKINNNLGIDLSWRYFTYAINGERIADPVSGTMKVTEFTATATKEAGTCAGATMSITQDGGPVEKQGCDAW